MAFTACRAASRDTIRRVSVEAWTAIIAAFVALMALYLSVQSASAAVRPADAAENKRISRSSCASTPNGLRTPKADHEG